MTRQVPLAMTAGEFRAAGHELVDEIAALLESVRARPVVRPDQRPEDVRDAVGADRPLPEAGTEPATLLREAARVLADRSLFNGHPRFFGYITSSPAPIGALADLLAAAVNPNVGGWTLSPAASEIEAQTIRWLSELIGYREGCGGVLVSGGNMANFVGFLAARTAMLGQDVRRKGLAGIRAVQANTADRLPYTVYGSSGTHTWIDKATDLFGLGTDAFRRIEVDEHQRMRVDALRAAIERDLAGGARPIAVIATAGSVSTGAVDPLRMIADVCREHGLWLHVDGAYGGFAAAAPDAVREHGGATGAQAAADLAALALADSVAIDPHKWLYAPLEAGCVLVRDPQVLRDAFAYHPPYYHFGVEATNYVDFGLQNSRGFRALKVWLGLRHAGRAGCAGMIADDIALARRLHENAARHPELEAATLSLSIATFRWVPPELKASVGRPDTERRLNEINEALLDRLQNGGEAFVSNAVVDGRYLLRACIVNFNTTAADVDALPEIIVRTGRAVYGETPSTIGTQA
ncbi:MAG TPA: aminotransferase class I/II-fold pyridoxal phosphate-dependent enzyme [Longimicrobiales bacterium]|nr:aminotransferase class I/II-fold pyridoxal phosphate-dependent enzyme [Longimicrobiales bacterium]